jgi:hypothetical protein
VPDVAHAYNPSTQEAGKGGSQVRGQPVLHSESLLKREVKKKTKKEERNI